MADLFSSSCFSYSCFTELAFTFMVHVLRRGSTSLSSPSTNNMQLLKLKHLRDPFLFP
jgi:hypothetical protein